MRTLRIALALLMLSVSAPLAVHAQVTIAVFPLSGFALGQDAGSHEALATALREMLIAELSNSPKFKTVDRNATDELLRSRRLSLSGKIKDDEAIAIGQLLGAQYYIGGSMVVDAKTARMDLRLTEIETGLIANTAKETGSKDDMLSVVQKVVQKFGDNLKVSARVADVVVPVPSQFAYSRGLDYEKRGDKKKAVEMFEAALKIFPDNAQAKAALDRVK